MAAHRSSRAGLWLCFAALASAGAYLAASRVDAAGDKPEDPFAMPRSASPAELAKFIERVAEQPVRTLPTARKKAAALDKAADAILAAKNADDETMILAIRAKIGGYQLLKQTGDDDAEQKATDFLKSLAGIRRPAVANVVAEESIKARLAGLEDMDAKQRRQFITEVLAHLAKAPLDKDALRLAVGVAEALEEEDEEEGAALYAQLSTIFAKSKDPEVQDYSTKLAGVARRLRLLGNSIDVVGTTLLGKPFDWKKYQGKVVLIDFWATWCGPCVAELPNVKENYERYHDKGFEVVGISLDEDRDQLVAFLKEKEIPWVTLFGATDNSRGWEHPMAVKYGVLGIPTVILVDQKGKVVDLNARGPKLAKLLEQLLGSVDAKGAEVKGGAGTKNPAELKRAVEKTATKPARDK